MVGKEYSSLDSCDKHFPYIQEFYMKKQAFSSEKYLNLQRDHIIERINQFDGKLYLEFGGKMLEDFHAARVLPGYEPDNKIKLL